MAAIQMSAKISAEFIDKGQTAQKILVPIDFSDVSIVALDYAVAIAKALGSTITVYHSITPLNEISLTGGVTINQEIEKQIKMLESQADETIRPYRTLSYENQNGFLKIEKAIKLGYIENDIQEFTSNGGYDFIVAGTKGTSGLEEIVFGSVAEQIVNNAKCPVLVVPKSATFRGIENIVYATKFDKADLTIIDELLMFSEYFGAKITCLHVSTNIENATEGLMQLTDLEENYWFTPIDKLRFEMISGESVLKSLHKYLDEQHPDMIAVLRQDRSFVENLFHQSVSKKLVFHSKVPVLVLQDVK